jgi:hypothetical protein
MRGPQPIATRPDPARASPAGNQAQKPPAPDIPQDRHQVPDRAVLPVPARPLVGVTGGIMGAALGAAENLDIEDDFKQRVQDMLQPATSAILVILRKAI